MFFELWGLTLLTIATLTYLLDVSLKLIQLSQEQEPEMTDAIKRMYN